MKYIQSITLHAPLHDMAWHLTYAQQNQSFSHRIHKHQAIASTARGHVTLRKTMYKLVMWPARSSASVLSVISGLAVTAALDITVQHVPGHPVKPPSPKSPKNTTQLGLVPLTWLQIDADGVHQKSPWQNPESFCIPR